MPSVGRGRSVGIFAARPIIMCMFVSVAFARLWVEAGGGGTRHEGRQRRLRLIGAAQRTTDRPTASAFFLAEFRKSRTARAREMLECRVDVGRGRGNGATASALHRRLETIFKNNSLVKCMRKRRGRRMVRWPRKYPVVLWYEHLPFVTFAACTWHDDGDRRNGREARLPLHATSFHFECPHQYT